MENSFVLHLTSMKCLFLAIFLFASCDFSTEQLQQSNQSVTADTQVLNKKGNTIKERFNTPKGFIRTTKSENSFAHYLRNLPLHKHGKRVILYNGSLKGNQRAQAAVINIDVGSQDLQQCADAVMRLRGEYLFKEKKYNQLHFNFTNGFNAKYSTWRNGKGISVNGNRVSWVNSSKSNASYESFRRYMNKVFMFAGTASLEKELKQKKMESIAIGDVLIKGGHPGHAVLVVDVASNDDGDKVFMLAQSYMPAQEIHVLKNPNNTEISPWYKLSEISDVIETPEWTFYANQLRSFD